MGSSGSKSGKGQSLLGGKSKKKGGDDGLIGNRKIRTIILSFILIAWAALAVSYLIDQADAYNNVSSIGNFTTCDYCKNMANAFTMAYVGCFVIIASAIFAVLLFFIDCDDKIGRIAGVGLIVGGLLYLIGWVWYVNEYRSALDDVWDAFSDDLKNKINAYLSARTGEAVLPSISAVLLGLDVFMHLFDDEAKRLATNLLNIFIVACMAGPVYYIQGGSVDLSLEEQIYLAALGYPPNSDAYEWIGTGYMILGAFSLTYVILYICTCCTCDCKDTRCIRLLMAIGLIAGGVLGAIGYYIYAGDFTSDQADSASDYTVYYIGYTVCIIGFPVVWALDIGVDDMKG